MNLDAAVKVGAIVSSLTGFTALATLTGGVITWTRFRQADLPADQAVAAMSAAELVTVGAVALTAFAVVSLVAVGALYLLDSEGKAGPRNKFAVTALAVAGTIYTVVRSEPGGWQLIVAIVVAIVTGVLVWLAASKAWTNAHDADKPSSPLGPGIQATLAGGLPAVLGALVLGLLAGHWWVAAMTSLAAILAAVGLRIAHDTHAKFRWYGVGIFLATVIFGAALSTLRTYSETKLQPVAIVQTAEAGGGGLAGFYVTDTSDSVVLAYVDRCKRDGDLRLVPTKHSIRDTGRLVKLPRSTIAAISVGRPATLELATKRGPTLLAEIHTRLRLTSTSGSPTSAPCAGEGIPDLSVRPTGVVLPQMAERLAKRYRPRLMFDTGEPWRPLRIDSLLAERNEARKPLHQICLDGEGRKEEDCEPLVRSEELSDTRAPKRIIDFDGDRLGGAGHATPSLADCPGDQPRVLQDCDAGPATALYYNVTQANGRFYVDYWWFLRYNHFARKEADGLCKDRFSRAVIGCFDHEGDWEGVTAITKPGAPETLASVGLAAHSGVYRFAAAKLEVDSSGRPLIYVARGSHASYPHPCPQRCRQFDRRLGVQLPETNTDGTRPWAANDDDAALVAMSPLWRAFKGWWGSTGCRAGCRLELGPKSPAIQRRYRRPWCQTGPTGHLQCDGAQPTAATAVAVAPVEPG